MASFDSYHRHPDGGPERGRDRGFGDSELAARLYLDAELRSDPDRFAHLWARDSVARAPAFELVDIQRTPFGDNRTVRFRQLHRGVPVFGSRVVVELTPGSALVAIDMRTARVEGDPFARLSPWDALGVLDDLGADVDRSAAPAPEMVFFGTASASFRLAYFLAAVPSDPFDRDRTPTEEQLHLERLAPDAYHVLIDAHEGRVLLAYSASPMLDLPAICRGLTTSACNSSSTAAAPAPTSRCRIRIATSSPATWPMRTSRRSHRRRHRR
jgi:hypothetical protein